MFEQKRWQSDTQKLSVTTNFIKALSDTLQKRHHCALKPFFSPFFFTMAYPDNCTLTTFR